LHTSSGSRGTSMTQRNRPIGYDVELEDDALYPQPRRNNVIRYRPVETRDIPSQRAVTRPRQQGVRKPNQYDTVNVYVRQRSSTQAPRPPQAPRPGRQQTELEQDDNQTDTEPLRPSSQPIHTPRFHWVWYLGLGMIAMLILWMVGAIALTWWNGYQDDLRYGHPRTYQTDARVGHNDATTPSHFIALNLNHHVEVVEFLGGDATQAKVYLGPTLIGPQSDLDIVSVSFKDVNGDGKLDLILSVDTAKYLYINDNGAFRVLHAGEHITM